MKSKGQTDQAIMGLSKKDFKERFGFNPRSDEEKRHFATHGERFPPGHSEIEDVAEHQAVIRERARVKREELAP